MAYAHARGVIHRDLKPSNVMIGAFGEVQVMDWGLAKVLPRGGIVDDARAGKLPQSETVIATARSGSDSDHSRAGSVMGTPAYMAPEQARGEVDQIDERADVFALGSILCEILTGQPAFMGRNSGELQRKASRGDLAEAFARLDACTADPDLVALARLCLAPEPHDRPRDASALAERITRYVNGVQERLRTTEITRAAETARAEEAQRTAVAESARAEEAQRATVAAEARVKVERQARRLQLGLAASILGLMTVGGGGYLWNQRQTAQRVAKTTSAVDVALADAARLSGEARAAPAGEMAKWGEALSAMKQAQGLLAQGDSNPGLRERVSGLLARIEHDQAEAEKQAVRLETDRTLLSELESIRSNSVEDDEKRTDAEYAAAFRKAGLDFDKLGSAEAGQWVAARSEPVELAGYLDDWAWHRRATKRAEAEWRRLVAAARAADPDPWRDALRDKLGSNNDAAMAEFRRLADDEQALEAQPPESLLLLAGQFKRDPADRERAARFLRRATMRYPDSFWLHLRLATALGEMPGEPREIFPDPEEAIRHLTAAIALRPRSASVHNALGLALHAQGKLDEALSVYIMAVRLKPGDPLSHNNLGIVLMKQRKPEAAAAAFRETIRLQPDYPPSHTHLGMVLREQGKLDEAAAAHREAIRLQPNFADAHTHLGSVLREQGKLDEAIAAHREAIRLQPNFAHAHTNLGTALFDQGKVDEAIAEARLAIRLQPDFAPPHVNLGFALSRMGQPEEAVTEYRTAIRLEPEEPLTHTNLGIELRKRGKLDEAVAAHREAIRLNPEFSVAYNNLAVALNDQKKFDEAIAACREAIRLDPRSDLAHNSLAISLFNQGKADEAIAEFRAAIALKPDSATAHRNLAVLLKDQGKLDEAIAESREAIRLKPDYYEAYDDLARVLKLQGKPDDAIAELRDVIGRKVITLDSQIEDIHDTLGWMLGEMKRHEEAISEFREAIRLNPANFWHHHGLLLNLRSAGHLEEAVPVYRERVRNQPSDALAHAELADALRNVGRVTEATTEAREAVRLDPKSGAAWQMLAWMLLSDRKWTETIPAHREAIKLGQDDAWVRMGLAIALRSQGLLDESVAEFKIAREKAPPGLPVGGEIDQNLAIAERQKLITARLPAVLKGDDSPKDAQESLDFAILCFDRNLHAAATRLYAAAFSADPILADDSTTWNRYNAACNAVLAASASGDAEPEPDDAARARLRGQAIDWLKAELAALSLLEATGTPQARAEIRERLHDWKFGKFGVELATVRDADALTKLPEAEQKEWQALWAEVDALLWKVAQQ